MIASLIGELVEGEHMMFLHIHETFYSIRVQYENIRPSGTVILEDFEKLFINVIEGIDMKGKDVRAMVHPMSP